MSISSAWKNFRGTMRSIRNGEFLLRIRADKFYVHIMYLFVLMWATILLSLQVDKTLTRVGDNETALKTLRIHHSEREAALVKLRSASAAEIRLKEMGADVGLPEKPATIIKGK